VKLALPRPNTKPQFRVFDDSKPPLSASPSPFHPKAWAARLQQYPSQLGNTLSSILTYGACIGYEGPKQHVLSKNLSSASLDPATIQNQLDADLADGRITQVQPTTNFISSPLGLVPKHDGGLRRIHHLSHPEGTSVNDHIPARYAAISYTRLREVLEAVARSGRHSIIIKRDVKSAFRTIPIAPHQQWLMGFTWAGMFYTEKCLSFGLRTAPFLFNLFAEAFHWILQTFLHWVVFHYLDDFMTILPPSSSTALVTATKDDYKVISAELGIPPNDSKDQDGTVVDLLGIEVDTNAMMARLSHAKRARAIELVTAILKEGSVSLHRMQQVTGLLSFCSQVVRLGRTHLRRLYDFEAGFWTRGGRKLTSAARQDLLFWRDLLPAMNGKLFFDKAKREDFSLYTDACNYGYGGYASKGNELPDQATSFAIEVSHKHRRQHIGIKEARALRLAFQLYSHHWEHGTVTVHVDNEALYFGLINGTIRGAAMNPLRTLLLIASAKDITIVPKWIRSADNALADALSRFDVSAITNLCPHWQNHSQYTSRRHSRHLSSTMTQPKPSSSGVALLKAQGATTLVLSPTTKKSANRTGWPIGQQRQNRSPTLSPAGRTRTTLRSEPSYVPAHSEATSQHCAPTTLTINSASRYSTTMPSSLGSLAVRSACSLGRKRRDYRLPKTYSGGCLSPGKRLKNWTGSIYAPHGPWGTRVSCEWASSPTKTNLETFRQLEASREPTSPLQKMIPTTPSRFGRAKPTATLKASVSSLLPRNSIAPYSTCASSSTWTHSPGMHHYFGYPASPDFLIPQ
jgi:hypothetical protein